MTGDLLYDGSRIETREVNSENTRLSSALIVGSIPCGEATVEEEYVEDYVNLPENMFGKKHRRVKLRLTLIQSLTAVIRRLQIRSEIYAK